MPAVKSAWTGSLFLFYGSKTDSFTALRLLGCRNPAEYNKLSALCAGLRILRIAIGVESGSAHSS